MSQQGWWEDSEITYMKAFSLLLFQFRGPRLRQHITIHRLECELIGLTFISIFQLDTFTQIYSIGKWHENVLQA